MTRKDPSSILPAWQEFCGFDREGQNGWFDIDAERGTEAFPGLYTVWEKVGDGVYRAEI